jgi:hypothetical protein
VLARFAQVGHRTFALGVGADESVAQVSDDFAARAADACRCEGVDLADEAGVRSMRITPAWMELSSCWR